MKADARIDDASTNLPDIGANVAGGVASGNDTDVPESVPEKNAVQVEDGQLSLKVDQLEKENRDLEAQRRQAEQALALTRRQVSRLLEENVALRARAEESLTSLEQRGAELVKAEHALEVARHKLATAESALRQRQEENAQAWAELSPARSRIAELKQLLAEGEERASALENELAEANACAFNLAGQRRDAEERLSRMGLALESERRQRDILKLELGALRNLADALQDQVAANDAERKVIEERRDEAYSEIAAITRLLRASESIAAQNEAKADWMARVLFIMLHKRRWASLLPASWRRKPYWHKLAQEQLFDAEAYLQRYNDVRASGQDPLRHYIAHGMAEGRQR
jgi:chromosome segregation ATPase